MDLFPDLYITKGNKKSITKIILGKIKMMIRPTEYCSGTLLQGSWTRQLGLGWWKAAARSWVTGLRGLEVLQLFLIERMSTNNLKLCTTAFIPESTRPKSAVQMLQLVSYVLHLFIAITESYLAHCLCSLALFALHLSHCIYLIAFRVAKTRQSS